MSKVLKYGQELIREEIFKIPVNCFYKKVYKRLRQFVFLLLFVGFKILGSIT